MERSKREHASFDAMKEVDDPLPPAELRTRVAGDSQDAASSDISTKMLQKVHLPLGGIGTTNVATDDSKIFELCEFIKSRDCDAPLSNNADVNDEFISRFKDMVPSEFPKGIQNPCVSTVLQHYACALSQRILLQGKLYITPTYVAFFSPFNDMTIFGAEPTTAVIKLADIEVVRKKNTAMLFPNAIEIVLRGGFVYFFASLVNRNKTYDFLDALIEFVQKDRGEAKAEQENVFAVPPRVAPWPSLEAVGADNPSKLPLRLLKHSWPVVVVPLHIEEAYNKLYIDSSPSCMLDRVIKASGALAYRLPPWERIENVVSCPNGTTSTTVYQRKLEYDRDLDASMTVSAFLRLPSPCHFTEYQYLYFIGQNSFCLDVALHSLDVPYGDRLVIYSRQRITALDNCRCQIDLEMEFDWLKKTLMASAYEWQTANQFLSMVPFVRSAVLDCLGAEEKSLVESKPRDELEEDAKQNRTHSHLLSVNAICTVLCAFIGQIYSAICSCYTHIPDVMSLRGLIILLMCFFGLRNYIQLLQRTTNLEHEMRQLQTQLNR